MPLTMRQENNAYYHGTKFMLEFGEKMMKPLLATQLKKSVRERAVIEIYARMLLMLGDLVKLDHPDHFQSMALVARSLFELWIDLELIAKDGTGKSAESFFGLGEMERFRRASEIVKFDDLNPGKLGGLDTTQLRKYVANPARQKRCANQQSNHWAGKLAKRAKLAGQEASYVRDYAMLSWFAHASAAATVGIGKDGVEGMVGVSHGVAQNAFVGATLACARLFKLSELPQFELWSKALRTKTASLISAEQVRQLQELQRRFATAPISWSSPPAPSKRAN